MGCVIDFEPIFERIAQEENTTVEEVKANIEAALIAGQESTDPEVRARWAAVPCEGDVPTLNEILTYVAQLTLQEHTHVKDPANDILKQ